MFFKIKIVFFLLKIKLEKFLSHFFPNFIFSVKKYLFLNSLKDSRFYSNFLRKGNNLSFFPIINKLIFMENFDNINTCGITIDQAKNIAHQSEESRDFSPMINNISVGMSTGTSGNQSLFLVGENERAKWVAYMLDRVVKFSLKSQKIAFFLRANNKLYESSNSKLLQFNFFDIFLNFNLHIKRLNDINPDVLIAQPSVLRLICEKISSGIIKISPQKVISVAEVLTKEDKEYFQDIFSVKIDQVYQCAEGFLAYTCKYGYLHFNEDFLIIEKKYLNDEKTKFHPIITDLIRRKQPIVRYELNDIITERNNCKCGSKFIAIEKIEGRSDDTFRLKNIHNQKIIIFPDLLRRMIVMSDSNIEDYQIIQKNETSVTLYVKSSTKHSFSLARKAIADYLLNLEIKNIEITNSPKLIFNLGDKKRRVINEHKI